MSKKILFLTLIFFGLMGNSLYNRMHVSAATAVDWQAGRIIDDAIFTDPNAMTVGQIQNFLNGKVGTGGYDSIPGQCDTNGVRNAQPYSSATRAQYAASLSRPSVFTCLNGYYEVPKINPGLGIPASNYGGAAIPAGAKSAAQLIWDAAQRYNISPKVLLVTIQKESAGPLTTDDWPFQKQYTYAMGAHCPDSGPGGAANCDENYAGFSIQISESAALLRYYLDNMDQPWWPYKKLGDNNILFQNANPDCGSSVVSIASRATAALYTYTPYQPNQAALNNMYGLGDGCSAYGNRNFWRIYRDWFGSTIGNCTTSPGYQYEVASGWINPPNEMFTGDTASVTVKVINTGSETWYNDGPNPVRLGNVNDVPSAMYSNDGTWLSTSRISAQERVVRPCEIATYRYTYSSHEPGGQSIDKINLVAESLQWLPDHGWFLGVNNIVFKPVKVAETTITTTPSAHYDQPLSIALRNDGNFTWKKNVINIGTDHDNASPFYTPDHGWANPNRIIMAEDNVAPGEIAHYNLVLRTPIMGGTYFQAYSPIYELKRRLSPISMYRFDVPYPQYNYALQSVSPGSVTLKAGQTQLFSILLKNTGNATWRTEGLDMSLRLGTENPRDGGSVFYQNGLSGWISPNRIKLASDNVKPGDVGEFRVTISAPQSIGLYVAHLHPLIDGVQWLDSGEMIRFGVNVAN